MWFRTMLDSFSSVLGSICRVDQGQYTLEQHLTEYDLIPGAIRQAFEQPYRHVFDPLDPDAFLERAVVIHFGHDDPFPDGATVRGYYNGDVWVSALAGTQTLVHEFGHHIDDTYGRLWPSGDGSTTKLIESALFASLWESVRGGIPPAAYAATNIYEWFAECFAYQILDNTLQFLRAAGGTGARARQVRAAFRSILPMPTPFLYD